MRNKKGTSKYISPHEKRSGEDYMMTPDDDTDFPEIGKAFKAKSPQQRTKSKMSRTAKSRHSYGS